MTKVKQGWLAGLVLVPMLALIGCSSMPLSTMYKMAKMNPLEVAPEQLVVAVTSPQDIGVRSGDVVLSMTFRSDVPEMNLNYRFFVQVDKQYPVPPALKQQLNANDKITVLRLSDSDAKQMREALAKIRAYRQEHDEGAGSMNLELVSACSLTTIVDTKAELSVYLKLATNEAFFPFLEDLAVNDLQQLSVCDTKPNV
ncbi:hypothetical protein [Shewanella sp.]|uniref:hypothetical protein n=1 Tax=Shewanella sp. TaxID=50422 RepID=UPI003A986A56